MLSALDPTFLRILFVGSRMTGFLMVVPGFGEVFVRPRIRILLMMALSIVFALGMDANLLPSTPVPLAGYIYELVKGLFLGLLVRFILEGMRFLGDILGNQLSSNAMASTHLTQESHSVFSEFIRFFFLVLIFVLDLHHLFFKAFQASYSCFEAAPSFLLHDMAFTLVQTFSKGVYVSLQLAAPFLILGLIYYLILGFLNRFVPFVPVFFVGKPLEIATLLTLLSFCLVRFVGYFESFFRDTLGFLLPYG